MLKKLGAWVWIEFIWLGTEYYRIGVFGKGLDISDSGLYIREM
jgi:hypothetical protein